MDIQRFSGEDYSLLVRIQRGNQQALSLFYDRHAAGVYSMALRVLRQPALAEEIASDIFIEVWHDPKRFMDIRGSFSIAMAILARNRAVEKLPNEPAAGRFEQNASVGFDQYAVFMRQLAAVPHSISKARLDAERRAKQAQCKAYDSVASHPKN